MGKSLGNALQLYDLAGAPSSPPSGSLLLYYRGGQLYQKTSAGVETPIDGTLGVIGIQVVDTSVSGTYTVDPGDGTDFTLTLVGNTVLAEDNMEDGQHITVHFIQDGSGGKTITLDAGWYGTSDIVFEITEPSSVNSVVLAKVAGLGIIVKHIFYGE